eukprot:3556286-Pleurochrysis_carterae.AAC.1
MCCSSACRADPRLYANSLLADAQPIKSSHGPVCAKESAFCSQRTCCGLRCCANEDAWSQDT